MKPVRTILVGLNFGYYLYREQIAGKVEDYIDICGVYDLDQAKTAEIAASLGVRSFKSFQEVINDPDSEALLLMTGPQNRAALVEEAVLAGKHVMTTKPFSLSSVETLRVLELAQRHGIVVHMNSPLPLLPADLQQILAWRQEYCLGKLVAFRASTYCSYREQADGSWYDDPRLCPIAPVFRLGIYLLNDLVRLISPVQDVSVFQSRIFTGRPTPDNAQISLLCRDGEIGQIFASFCIKDYQHYRCTLELNYENGTIYRNQGPIAKQEQMTILELAAAADEVQMIKKVKTEPAHAYPWQDFCRMIRNRQAKQDLTPAQVAAAIRILEMAAENLYISKENKPEVE